MRLASLAFVLSFALGTAAAQPPGTAAREPTRRACRRETWGIAYAVTEPTAGSTVGQALSEVYFWARTGPSSPTLVVRTSEGCRSAPGTTRCIAFDPVDPVTGRVESRHYVFEDLEVITARTAPGADAARYRVQLTDTYSRVAPGGGADAPTETTFEMLLGPHPVEFGAGTTVVAPGDVTIEAREIEPGRTVRRALLPLPELPAVGSALLLGIHRGHASVQAVYSHGHGLLIGTEAAASSPSALPRSLRWSSDIEGCELRPTEPRDGDPLALVVASFDGRQLEATYTLRTPPAASSSPRRHRGRRFGAAILVLAILALVGWSVRQERGS